MRFFYTIIFVAITVNQATAQLNPYNYNNIKLSDDQKNIVVSAHALASDAGVQMLQLGGNAFDAAIATQLALAVVYPGAGNIGGGGFLVAHTAKGENIALDYREVAPASANKDMYLDDKGNPITLLSMQGHLASGVPGTVAGLFATLPYAKLPFTTLIAPAIKLAKEGFAVTAAQAADFNNSKAVFEKNNKQPVAFVKAIAWKAGDTLIQPQLAATLQRISDFGLKGFYEGTTATMIVNAMQKNNGIISLSDLKNYTVKKRVVMKFGYKGYDIVTMPLPSSGGIILQQLLKMTALKNLASKPFQSTASVQLITEAERLAFADRAEYLGDPDFVKVPVTTLVSDGYLKKRIANYTEGKPGKSSNTTAGIIKESEQTTHISIIDAAGNAVAVTTTLNDHFGSKTIIDGAGFIMNNEMDDFSVKPGVPNMYGAIGNDKNAIAPGKRMLSSMTPTIVLKNNQPFMVVGTPGGTTIPTSVFQTIVNVIDYKLSPQNAVNQPKFHHQWLPDVVYVENDYPQTTINNLTKMGYTVTVRGNIGRTELIVIDNKQKTVHAVADKRGDDDVRGY
ncbi:gamma-glutamyltransferase [Ferruginibacter yonginensis]|uniref:Glutathione hydrolase proenzyme n=1 Tax=Ferruginibacter yonginensis TaxID=1310416 RepID=A0ABV8QW10_9BACT